MKKTFLSSLLALWNATVCVTHLSGAPVVFNVDPTQSQVTLSGTLEAFGALSAPIEAQSAGSLTTSFGGSLNADITGTSIEFTGSSLIAAQTNPVPQQPAPGGASGSAPADYGGLAQEDAFFTTISVEVALRNLVLDLGSSPMTLTDGGFSSTSLEFSFSTNVVGSIDYNSPSLGETGTAALVGSSADTSAGESTLTTTGSVQVLMIPVNMTFTDTAGALNGTTLVMVGTIEATRTIPPPPIINGITVTNSMVELTVTNAQLQSQVLVSTNLSSWSTQSATVSAIGGLSTFTFPVSGNAGFFRIEQ